MLSGCVILRVGVWFGVVGYLNLGQAGCWIVMLTCYECWLFLNQVVELLISRSI